MSPKAQQGVRSSPGHGWLLKGPSYCARVFKGDPTVSHFLLTLLQCDLASSPIKTCVFLPWNPTRPLAYNGMQEGLLCAPRPGPYGAFSHPSSPSWSPVLSCTDVPPPCWPDGSGSQLPHPSPLKQRMTRAVWDPPAPAEPSDDGKSRRGLRGGRKNRDPAKPSPPCRTMEKSMLGTQQT